MWDASPGYLNATGSQFRLQTSMESVAEFRVNAGLAPAESGLGTGGNITVVTKSGANTFTGSVFDYYRDDALDSTQQVRRHQAAAAADQFGGSIGGPIASNKVFFFGSYEGLRQDTGLSFVESVPSNVARDQILAGVPTTSGGAGRRAHAGGGAAAGRVPDRDADVVEPARRPDVAPRGQSERGHVRRVSTTFNDRALYVRYLYSDGEIDTPDQTVTPRRVLATQTPQNFVASWQTSFGADAGERVQGRLQPAGHGAVAFGPPGYPDRQCRCPGRFVLSSTDAATRASPAAGCCIRATSAVQDGGSLFDPHRSRSPMPSR